MWKHRITALVFLLAGLAVGYFAYSTEADPASRFGFKLGLDLSGGTHLVYVADVAGIAPAEVKDSLDALRDVVERRINLFGVSEPSVQVENPSFTNEREYRLVIDLPNVTDIDEAVALIGQTPLLDFRVENSDISFDAADVENGTISLDPESLFEKTELTGRYLERATLEFDPTTALPIIGLRFNQEGAALFEEITGDNVGKVVAIFLDGAPISTPVVNEAISGGVAQITGSFTPAEAKELVGRLNSGALPVPIELVSTQTIGATLGTLAVERGVDAAIIGFLAIVIFLMLWYRLPGLIAAVSLGFYACIVLALFKLIPVTLSAAGIAGFIISVGIAVDANVLIFERLKEELRAGADIASAVQTGFDRAWTSIRDSNTSSIITAIILYWFGTSLIKGFALTFAIGVLTSLLSAITMTRAFLFALNVRGRSRAARFFFGSGFFLPGKEPAPRA